MREEQTDDGTNRDRPAVDGVPRAARLAVTLAFLVMGLVISNWVTRIPAIQTNLDLSEGRLGLALLSPAVGALLAMSIVGWVIARLGSRPVTTVMLVAFCLSLSLPALAPSFAALAAGLFVFGACVGALDVASNAQGVTVERRYGRPILSSFHAAYSVGALVGAVIGGVIAGSGVEVRAHLIGASMVLAIISLVISRGLLPAKADMVTHGPRFVRPSRRLALLGVVAFCALLGEGAVADWSAVYLAGPLETGPGLAAAGFAGFSLTMAVGRLVGDRLTEAWGPVALTRRSGALAAGGFGVALLVGHPVAAVVGFGCVGAGLACVVPVVFSAAGQTPGVAPAPAIAAVSMAGYTGFLVGPPVIGFTAEVTTLPIALGIVALVCALIVVLSRSVSPVKEPAMAARVVPAAR